VNKSAIDDISRPGTNFPILPNTTSTLRYNQQLIGLQVSFPILHFLAVQFNLSIVRTAGEAHTVDINKYLIRYAALTQMWPIHINTFLLLYWSFWYKLINSMDKICCFNLNLNTFLKRKSMYLLSFCVLLSLWIRTRRGCWSITCTYHRELELKKKRCLRIKLFLRSTQVNVLHVIKLNSVQMYNAKISNRIAEKLNNARYWTKCSLMLYFWVLASTIMFLCMWYFGWHILTLKILVCETSHFEFIRLPSESLYMCVCVYIIITCLYRSLTY